MQILQNPTKHTFTGTHPFNLATFGAARIAKELTI